MKDEKISKEDKRATFLDFDRVLGLGFKSSSKKLLENLSGEKQLKVSEIPSEVSKLLEKREQARRDKNWEVADKARDEIQEKGYKIVDSPKGAKLIKES